MLDFVIPCNCLVEAAALKDVEDRSEGLSVDHRGVVGESGDDGWLHEVAALSLSQVVPAEDNLATQ